jgi:carbamoyl-phosphate synthase large subunit
VAVKEAVLPFDRFPGVDALLGPEMRSTGEVMGIDTTFGAAFAKSQAGTGSMVLPTSGTVFVSVANRDKRSIVFPAKRLADLGFDLVATDGTADLLQRAGVDADVVAKVSTGDTALLDMVADGRVTLILNTPSGPGTRDDGYMIRQEAIAAGVPCVTTLSGILAAIQGIEAVQANGMQVASLQEHLARVASARDARPRPSEAAISGSDAADVASSGTTAGVGAGR